MYTRACTWDNDLVNQKDEQMKNTTTQQTRDEAAGREGGGAMSGTKAYIMHRDYDPGHSTTEWWKTKDGRAIFVDFNANANKTMALPYDLRSDRVMSWAALGVWRGDMTGGKAMQALGYEPVEEAHHG